MNNLEKKFVVGVDIGGQSAKCGVVDARGNVIAQTRIVSNTQTEAEDFVKELAVALKGIIAQAGAEGQVRGIGVGAPNGNHYTGQIEGAVNLTWGAGRVIDLAKMLSAEMDGIPVALTNDANAAAMGEMTYGAARGMKDFIMITLGTGKWSTVMTALPANWATRPSSVTTAVPATAGRRVAWRHTLPRPVCAVPPANGWNSPTNLPSCAATTC